MRPLVIDTLRDDLISYGRCTYSIEDSPEVFFVERQNPFANFYSLELY